jgi:hypothetical protein
LRREETKLDPRSIIKYPKDIMKKRDPASSCPIFRSFSTMGKRGDRTIREMKFKKKISTRKRRGVIWERKDEGPLSIFPDVSTLCVFIFLIFNPQPRISYSIILTNISISEGSFFTGPHPRR